MNDWRTYFEDKNGKGLEPVMLPPQASIYQRYVPAVTPAPDQDGPAYWFAFSGDRLLVRETSSGMSIPYARSLEQFDLIPARFQFLGSWEGESCYSADIPPEAVAPEGMSFVGLRALYGVLEDDLFHLAGRAVQIVEWDRTHLFCGSCGVPTAAMPNERAKVCPKCGSASYPRIAPAVITAILKDKQILLARARHFRGSMHSLIAGFVEPGETLEDCVRREIMEEVGVRVKNIRYFGSQQWPFPHSLMIGFTAEYESGEITVDGEEIVEAGWFDPDRLPEIPSRISIARKIIDWYAEQYAGG